VRNLPCYLTRDAFLELIDAQGLSGEYDFVYLPMDFKTKQSIGYAFVNFCNSAAARLFRSAMNGFKSWRFRSHKVCSAQWSQTQGFEKNIKLVRRSDVMKKSGVPDEFKPMVFVEGLRVPFPDPPERERSGPGRLRFQPAMAGTIPTQRYR
jgi:RNA recognition motif-containing protein